MKKPINRKMLIIGITTLVIAIVTAVSVTTYALWSEKTQDSTDIDIDNEVTYNPSLKYILFLGLDANGNFTNTDSDTESYCVVGYSGLVAELIIPSQYANKPVTRISTVSTIDHEYYFAGNTMITSITIPASVTVIDDGTFANVTYLNTVVFEYSDESISIGTGAFAGCENLATFTTNSRTIVGQDYLFGTPLEKTND